jgi:O-antigen/teichoic acid export membrane protein
MRLIIKNILSNWCYLFLSIFSVFILYPYSVRVLGDEQYGIWLLISSITSYFFLFQLGVPMANVRFVSKYRALGEEEKVNEVVSSNFIFFSLIGLIILLIGGGISCFINQIFHIPEQYMRITRVAMLIASVDVSLGFTFEVFEGILHALQEFVVFNLVKNILLVMRVVLTFVILKFAGSLIVLPFLLLTVTIFQSLCFYIYIKKKYPEIKIKKEYIKFDVFKIIAGYSMFVLIANVAGKINLNTAPLVVGSMVSVSMVVFYTIGNNFIIYSFNLISGISSVLIPAVSKLEALNEPSKLQDLYLKYSKNISFLTTPLCLFFFIFGADFISVWMGKKYSELSGNVLTILTLSNLFLFVQQGVALPILLGTSKVKFPTILMLITSILNVFLSILLCKNFGIYGVAWGIALPNLIYSFFIIWYMCKKYSLSFISYCYRGLLVPASAGLFFALPAFILKMFFKMDSYYKIFATVLISASIYSIFLFFFFLNMSTRADLIRKIKSFSHGTLMG